MIKPIHLLNQLDSSNLDCRVTETRAIAYKSLPKSASLRSSLQNFAINLEALSARRGLHLQQQIEITVSWLEPFPPDLDQLRRPNASRPGRRGSKSDAVASVEGRNTPDGRERATRRDGGFCAVAASDGSTVAGHALRRPPGHITKSPRRS